MDPEPENPTPETIAPLARPAAAAAQPGPDEHDHETSETGPGKAPRTQRRTGKVARLPKAIRDRINFQILDGVPYPKIREDIGDPVKHITDDSIGEWKKGGYKEWLIELQRADDVRATRDAALTLVEQKAGATVQDASRTIASAQLYELLLSFDPRGFAAALQDKPELYFRLINSLARLSEGEAVCSRLRAQGALIEDQFNATETADGKVVIPKEKLNQLIRLIKLL